LTLWDQHQLGALLRRRLRLVVNAAHPPDGPVPLDGPGDHHPWLYLPVVQYGEHGDGGGGPRAGPVHRLDRYLLTWSHHPEEEVHPLYPDIILVQLQPRLLAGDPHCGPAGILEVKAHQSGIDVHVHAARALGNLHP